MSLLDNARANRAFSDIKSALREIGCDVNTVDDLTDVSKVIREECVTGPNAVINASLMSGAGIKIVPIERKGYKISANDEAVLSGDVCDELQKGASIHKALWVIANKMIPNATKTAASAPAIIAVDMIKSAYDGIDYYENPAFGRRGVSQKTGLHPNEWYLRIITVAQAEPLYISMAAFVCDLKKEFLNDARHMVQHMIEDAFCRHNKKFPHKVDDICRPLGPNRPKPCGPKPDHSFGGFEDPIDPGFTIDPDEEEPSVPDDTETPDDTTSDGSCDTCKDALDEIIAAINNTASAEDVTNAYDEAMGEGGDTTNDVDTFIDNLKV